MTDDNELLDWAEFVASKFDRNHEGWTYSRNVGALENIRYRHDHTGYQSLFKRVWRGIRGPRLSQFRRRGLVSRVAWFMVCVRKKKNLPDGVVNQGSIITFWEEDGEYIVLFSPSVGMKVLEWLRAEPDNPYAVAVVEEMKRLVELSWGEKKGDCDD